MTKEDFEKVQREDGMKEEFIQSLWNSEWRPAHLVAALSLEEGTRRIRETNAVLRINPRFAHHYEARGDAIPEDVVDYYEPSPTPGSYASPGDAGPAFESLPGQIGISVERFHEILHSFGYSERNAERLWGKCGEGLQRFPANVVESELAVVAEKFAETYAMIDLIESGVGRNASEKVI